MYGQEPVAFRVQAPRAAAVQVTLVDEQGRSVAQGNVAAPGRFLPPDVQSGDFTLHVSGTEVACAVTVNRELTRASQPAR